MPTYSALYTFGDSISDAGNLFELSGASVPVNPPYFVQTYGTTAANDFSNGPTWVQNLSVDLGFGQLAPSLLGGTDFAYGGAQTGVTSFHPSGPLGIIDIPSQLTQFKTSTPTPSANALYTMAIGGNDIFEILRQPGIDLATGEADVLQSVLNEVGAIDTLIADGAKNLLVVGVPDIGRTPVINLLEPPTIVTLGTELSAYYNMQLFADVTAIAQSDNVTIDTLDLFALIDSAIANPMKYGYTDVVNPVWSGNFTSSTSGTLVSTDTIVQDTYLFWDQEHPTESGHILIANAALQSLACFASGTRIATPDGDRAVEDIRVGDTVLTGAHGERSQLVTWTGSRRVDCNGHPDPEAVWPVRVDAGALGLNLPMRDLWLSPDHALLIDGQLIPVKYLIDGDAITQVQISRVTYHHVELAAHDVVLAEGVPAETFLDIGQRAALNGGVVVALHPDFAARTHEAASCAPIVIAGSTVERARSAIASRRSVARADAAMDLAGSSHG